MRKNLIVRGVLIFVMLCTLPFVTESVAQTVVNQDSLAFELQRQKVNHLLDQRTQRFGHYDESLRQRSGIFGMKSRRDMQRSIDILLDIARTDNEIFIETKKLLNHKDQLLSYQEFEKSRIQELADEYDQRINSYIQTISKLQKEQDYLRQELSRQQNKAGLYAGLLLLIVLGALAWAFVRYLLNQKLTKK